MLQRLRDDLRARRFGRGVPIPRKGMPGNGDYRELCHQMGF